MQQPLFTIEKVTPKLEKWTINNKEAIMMLQDPHWKDHHLSNLKVLRLCDFENKAAATFLDSMVQKAPNLTTLVVHHSYLKEIFRDKRAAYEEGKNEFKTQLKSLSLIELQLQHICREGCQVDPILEVLEVLYVKQCANLKTLVPSSVTFSHLKYLSIEKCNELINLIYTSTATNLVNLEYITLKECKSLEEILSQGMNDTRDEIVFRSLRSLTLDSLPRLKSFSSSQCFFRFPLLKRVVVRQCPRMKTFCGRATSTPMLRKVITKNGKDEEWFWEGDLIRTIKKIYADKIAFRDMELLDLSLYPELRDSWNSPIENKMFCNLKSLVVQNCDFLSDVLIPSKLRRALGNLEEIQVMDCDSLEFVFEFDIAEEEAISEKEASHLRKICLFNLPKLQYIWKPSLGGEREEDEVQIQRQQPVSFIAKVLFPNLKQIKMRDLPELKTIWHPFLTSNCFSNLKTMEVSKCEKLGNIFPLHMQRVFGSMEKLMVSDCNSVQVIFEFNSEMGNVEETTPVQELMELTLLRLSMLRQIWGSDPHLRFHNLQLVRVEDCNNLEYLLPFSIAMHATELEDITIKNAGRLKQIVSHKEGPVDSSIKFEFNHMISLVLWNLSELDGFFAGNHSLLCPLLKVLDIHGCVKLKLFKTGGTSGQVRVSDSIPEPHVSVQLPVFTLEEVIFNLEILALTSEDASMILQGQFSGDHFSKLDFLCLENFEDEHATFPYWFLQNISTLNKLVVKCSSFKELFREEKPVDDEGKSKTRTRIEELTLDQLHDLQHICKDGLQIDPVLEDLKYLLVQHCSKLKYLVPSSVTCTRLTYLEVENCNGLIHLINSSTAISMVDLKTMIIRNCNSLKQVVVEDEGEESKDTTAFISLEVLELECLPRLKMFCSSSYGLLELQWLEKVVISNCPRMVNFSLGKTETPILQKVLTQKQDGKGHWQSDLNTTVNMIFQDMADQIVDATKQEIPKLSSSSDDREQKENDSPTDPQEAATGTQEMCDTIKKPSISATQNVPSSTMTSNAVIDPSHLQALEASTSSIQDEDAGTKDMHETIQRPLDQNAEDMLITSLVHDTELQNLDVHLSKNLFNQTTTSVEADYKETVGTQELYESKRRFSVHDDVQNVLSPTMIYTTGKSNDPEKILENNLSDQTTNSVMAKTRADPAPSQATKVPSSSTTLVADVSNSFKELDISVQLLPYLEAGVKRHPQVLNWLNTKRRRVFASSSFSLFAEVTHILRTTRRVDLTEDDQNYIRDCCAVLKGVGLDDGWISYVHGRIEKCGDEEDLQWKVEEAEAEASNLKAQLESLKKEFSSVEESLVLFRDKASRLHGYLYLSTWLNALLFTILFFIIVFVYQKTN
ncbi:hypothetical protein QN277_023308 [Acacia crassicarpa]|uniref:Disease resistance protein At4g27190-like leucine-rich repeats domain-containing protein n=1 Tax=Acacia crassicarpa TaxID=499986 RepID=A0AAE1MLU5_9FABA|nr:hypothetical protein QN277_023308 [Acacia crassicarpa]